MFPCFYDQVVMTSEKDQQVSGETREVRGFRKMVLMLILTVGSSHGPNP